MDLLLDRRSVIAAGFAFPLLALPGCATMGGFGFEDAIRRLLTISSQRAPRVRKSIPTAANSSAIHDRPAPRMARPSDTRSSVATARAVTSAWRRGST